MKPEKLFLPNT